jgi:hypothetical protein
VQGQRRLGDPNAGTFSAALSVPSERADKIFLERAAIAFRRIHHAESDARFPARFSRPAYCWAMRHRSSARSCIKRDDLNYELVRKWGGDCAARFHRHDAAIRCTQCCICYCLEAAPLALIVQGEAVELRNFWETITCGHFPPAVRAQSSLSREIRTTRFGLPRSRKKRVSFSTSCLLPSFTNGNHNHSPSKVYCHSGSLKHRPMITT